MITFYFFILVLFPCSLLNILWEFSLVTHGRILSLMATSQTMHSTVNNNQNGLRAMDQNKQIFLNKIFRYYTSGDTIWERKLFETVLFLFVFCFETFFFYGIHILLLCAKIFQMQMEYDTANYPSFKEENAIFSECPK